MTAKKLLKLIRISAIIQAIIFILVVGICWLIDWFYLYMIGAALVWAGMLILAVSGFLIFGGLFSSGEDLTAFSISGAGKMDDHIKQGQAARLSRWGNILFVLGNGLFPLLIGNLLQLLGQ